MLFSFVFPVAYDIVVYGFNSAPLACTHHVILRKSSECECECLLIPAARLICCKRSVVTKMPARSFTLEEVSKHNKKEDAWIVVHGKVVQTPSIDLYDEELLVHHFPKISKTCSFPACTGLRYHSTHNESSWLDVCLRHKHCAGNNESSGN